jgi:outer membrane protein assembly factor BamB
METSAPADYSATIAPDRRWPAGTGLAILTALYWACILISRQIEIPGFIRFMGESIVGGVWILGALIWWLSRRRVSWMDRFGMVGAIVGSGVIVGILSYRFVPPFFMVLLALPIALTSWTAWLVVSQRLRVGVRRIGSVLAIILAWSPMLLIRMNGLTGGGGFDAHWRWTPTGEARFLAQKAAAGRSTSAIADLPDLPASTDWPDFRGVNHDGVVRDLKIETDWKAHPPTKIWGQLIGPAWSSMTVIGNYLFTQEQRGNNEGVVCLDARTGQEIWSREDPARFEDAMSGIGPRATPVYDHGQLFTVGGRGLVSCLDAKTARVIWQRNLFTGTSAELPVWGYASTPLLVNGHVIVYDIRKNGKGVIALDAKSGEVAWTAPAGEMSYASPQRARIGDKEQIIVFSDTGVQGLDPANGLVIWKRDTKGPGPRSVQPHAISSHQVLLCDGLDLGMTLLDVSQALSAWSVQPAWNTKMLKPSFNDVVVDRGYVYGLDGSYLACVDVTSGKRAWRAGRDGQYGRGQIVLLAEQHLLLITTEAGEVALVAADPSGYREWGKFTAIEGKTWNHPAVAGGRIFVRNAEQIACYKLPEMK